MIAVYGDSFTDPNPEDLIDYSQERLPWPIYLGKIMGNQYVHSYGRSATSLWWSYQKFLETYQDYTTVIFGYTNWNRWNTIDYGKYGSGDRDFVGPLSHIFHTYQLKHVADNFKPLAHKLIEVHPYIYNEQFNLFVYQTIFDSVNQLCRDRGIKIVNLMPFEDTNHPTVCISLKQSAGPCLTNLMNVSHTEHFISEMKPRFSQVNQLRDGPDRRFCHMNPYNNKILATIIKEAMENNVGYLNLINDPRWSYDPIHLQYIIDEL